LDAPTSIKATHLLYVKSEARSRERREGPGISVYCWSQTIGTVSAGIFQCQLSARNDERVINVLSRLYKSLVRPHLEYCSSVWSPYYSKDKQLLERIQHRFTRMVLYQARRNYHMKSC